MGTGGIPVNPYNTLGGFIPEDTPGFPENPVRYETKATVYSKGTMNQSNLLPVLFNHYFAMP